MTDPIPTGEYFEHLTGPGERWDTIAFQYYNDASLSHLIIEANRDDEKGGFVELLKPIPAIIPSGTLLRVPVVEIQSIDDNLLPPWRR